LAADNNEHDVDSPESDSDPSVVLDQIKNGTEPEQREAASKLVQTYMKASGRSAKKIVVTHHPDFENVLMVNVVESKDDEE